MKAYILVKKNDADSMMARLDTIIEQYRPFTLRYTAPILPVSSDYDFMLFPVDERAESVLTPEEWGARLATMPAEFLPPAPTAP